MSQFTEFCAAYFKKYFELHPTDAIYYGIQGYDHLLNDYSDESYRAETAFVDESLQRLRQLATDNLDQDEAIDCVLLEGKLTIQKFEHAKEDYRLKWPDTYSPIDAIYILTVRATNDLAGNLLNRLNRTPALIRQGIDNLSRKDANPPRLWTEMAIEGAKGAVGFLETLPTHPKVQIAGIDPNALKNALDDAKGAVGEFASFLESDLLPRSHGVYAVGTEHYNLLLKKKHYLDHDAVSLLAWGESLFTRTKQELVSLADELAPGKGVEAAARKIQDHHPTIAQILPAYQEAMEAARDVRQRKEPGFLSAQRKTARGPHAGVSPP